MFDFAQFLADKFEWSQSVFGTEKRTEGVIAHIREELEEIEKEPASLEEWVDVIFLATDGAARQGYSPDDVIAAMLVKHCKNLLRRWGDASDPTKSVNHIRDDEPVTLGD